MMDSNREALLQAMAQRQGLGAGGNLVGLPPTAESGQQVPTDPQTAAMQLMATPPAPNGAPVGGKGAPESPMALSPEQVEQMLALQNQMGTR